MKTYQVKLTFTEPMLGAIPLDPDVYEEHGPGADRPIGSDDELDTVIEPLDDENKGVTGFHKLEDGTPIEYDYVIKGFFKDSCRMLRRVKGSESSKIKAFLKVIDGLVFVFPRRIAVQLPQGCNGHELEILSRPLRASTAQGERIALAHSEMVPVGSTMEFEVEVMDGVTEKALREWLDYGKRRGMRQWRNAGYGVFTYEMTAL